jgi:hypothetical protein
MVNMFGLVDGMDDGGWPLGQQQNEIGIGERE